MVHKQRDPKKEALWRRLVRRQARSGMTVRAWCLDRQVKEATFHWWRRELARRDSEQAPSARRGRQQARRNRDLENETGVRDLRKTTAKSQRTLCVASSDGVRSRDSGSGSAFIPIRLAEDRRDAGEGRIEIVLTDGRCVRVTGSVDRQALADVLTALEHPSC